MSYRTEKDTMGEIKAPMEAYYGEQTACSMQNFAIGIETNPIEVITAFGILSKKTCRFIELFLWTKTNNPVYT